MFYKNIHHKRSIYREKKWTEYVCLQNNVIYKITDLIKAVLPISNITWFHIKVGSQDINIGIKIECSFSWFGSFIPHITANFGCHSLSYSFHEFFFWYGSSLFAGRSISRTKECSKTIRKVKQFRLNSNSVRWHWLSIIAKLNRCLYFSKWHWELIMDDRKNSASPDCFEILDTAVNGYELKIKEALFISLFKPELHTQVKHYNTTIPM